MSERKLTKCRCGHFRFEHASGRGDCLEQVATGDPVPQDRAPCSCDEFIPSGDPLYWDDHDLRHHGLYPVGR